MLGAIIGDMSGAPYEFGSDKSVDYTFLESDAMPTDDSVMTVAIGCACVNSNLNDEDDFKANAVKFMRELGNLYPNAGYGGMFCQWLSTPSMGAYNSFGNGSAMRVSPVAWASKSLRQAETLAKWSAEVTHNHPEGILGAQAVAAAIYMALDGSDKDEIAEYIQENYYDLEFDIDDIREDYTFDVTCQGSVPQAIKCFLEADSYEDAVRLAVSLGGDCDTQAAIAGSIAEAYFGIPDEIVSDALELLDETLLEYYNGYSDQLYYAWGR